MLCFISPSYAVTAKNKEIACLQGKLSELQRNGDKKANDLTKKLEDKEQLMKKARKFVSVTKGKLLKKEEETQELSKELYSVKGECLTSEPAWVHISVYLLAPVACLLLLENHLH